MSVYARTTGQCQRYEIHIGESRWRTYDLGVVVFVNKHVLQVQVMAIEHKLLWLLLTTTPIALTVRDHTQALHHCQEPRHLLLHALLTLRQVRNKERRALHPAVILVHRVARTLPLRLALLPVPLVRCVRAIVRQRRHLVVPRRLDLVRVEVQAVWCGLALVLEDHTLNLALNARRQILVRCPPWPAVQLVGVRELAAVRAEEGPGDDRPDVRLPC